MDPLSFLAAFVLGRDPAPKPDAKSVEAAVTAFTGHEQPAPFIVTFDAPPALRGVEAKAEPAAAPPSLPSEPFAADPIEHLKGVAVVRVPSKADPFEVSLPVISREDIEGLTAKLDRIADAQKPIVGAPLLDDLVSRLDTLNKAIDTILKPVVVPKATRAPAPTPSPVAPDPASAPAPSPRYWITLTNEPGIRALGRIENGVAVDIVRRERIAQPVASPPRMPVYLPQWGAGFGSPVGGCATGNCPR